jgi:hypothetical protein
MFNLTFAQNNEEKEEKKSSNLSQYYSVKFGFYSADGLNNGLILGIDGITEFNNYNFFLSGDIDLYPKKTISVFNYPQPDVSDQLILLFPLHVNFGYKLAEITDADTKFYAGSGVGYYFYIYNFTYQGGFPLVDSRDETKNGGNVFFTLFGRILIGKVFVEPRFYIASSDDGYVEDYSFTIDPSGFLITLGFQY